MKTILEISAQTYAELRAHLLPPGGEQEEAAFLFVDATKEVNAWRFRLREMAKLGPEDFVAQHADYLELADSTRARLIKRAHDLGASLIEVHSHVGPWRAAFSYSDIRGLKETVPNLWWRLKGRPYVAIVVSQLSIDALAWVDSAETPVPLDEIQAGSEVIRPTHTAWEEWP